MPEETEETIAENALKPKKMQGDSGSAEQHSIADQIEADKYRRAVEAQRRGIGIRYIKFVPPGSV